ncbi:MAG: SHOCT domain-containing protein [Deltaproteobacteria bacterium]|nr:SHOCT domain-containing protein [Deltaproteobacteria bacterium]
MAHTGGALDHYGCHGDHRKGDYHCHQGNLRGYSFRSRDAMLEAVRTGKLPEKPAEKEGFFEKYWPFGNKKDAAAAQPAAPAPEPTAPAQGVSAQPGTPQAPSPAAGGAPGTARSFEDRLRILSGLRDMGLITEEEYQARRKAILEQL